MRFNNDIEAGAWLLGQPPGTRADLLDGEGEVIGFMQHLPEDQFLVATDLDEDGDPDWTSIWPRHEFEVNIATFRAMEAEGMVPDD